MITLRFYEELNDFLAPNQRKKDISYVFSRKTSVKDLIESFGVPHTEVDLILVNGESVNFNYLIQDRDQISVYPMFESFDITLEQRLRPKPLRSPRFVIDVNLGRLTRYLRLLGFDCLYRNDFDDATIAIISVQQKRIVLTRDRKLLQRKIITHGYFVRAVNPKLQVKEVISRFDLTRRVSPFSRCTCCNGKLKKIAKEAIVHRLQPLTKKYFTHFLICPECRKIYWQGSHHTRAERLIEELTQVKQS